MLYSATLLAASRLYKRRNTAKKVYGSAVKSGSSRFDGQWFCDHALRADGQAGQTV